MNSVNAFSTQALIALDLGRLVEVTVNKSEQVWSLTEQANGKFTVARLDEKADGMLTVEYRIDYYSYANARKEYDYNTRYVCKAAVKQATIAHHLAEQQRALFPLVGMQHNCAKAQDTLLHIMLHHTLALRKLNG